MSAPTFASDARAKERDRRRRAAGARPLTSLDEEEEVDDDGDCEDGFGKGDVVNRVAWDAPRRRASDLWRAIRRSIPEDSEEVQKCDAAADAADPRRRLPRRSDAILARYERLPGRLDALLRRISA